MCVNEEKSKDLLDFAKKSGFKEAANLSAEELCERASKEIRFFKGKVRKELTEISKGKSPAKAAEDLAQVEITHAIKEEAKSPKNASITSRLYQIRKGLSKEQKELMQELNEMYLRKEKPAKLRAKTKQLLKLLLQDQVSTKDVLEIEDIAKASQQTMDKVESLEKENQKQLEEEEKNLYWFQRYYRKTKAKVSQVISGFPGLLKRILKNPITWVLLAIVVACLTLYWDTCSQMIQYVGEVLQNMFNTSVEYFQKIVEFLQSSLEQIKAFFFGAKAPAAVKPPVQSSNLSDLFEPQSINQTQSTFGDLALQTKATTRAASKAMPLVIPPYQRAIAPPPARKMIAPPPARKMIAPPPARKMIAPPPTPPNVFNTGKYIRNAFVKKFDGEWMRKPALDSKIFEKLKRIGLKTRKNQWGEEEFLFNSTIIQPQHISAEYFGFD